MLNLIEIDEFLGLAEELPVIDVRAPMEFGRGHIPGSVNMPLFDDKERAVVGTTYKKNGRENALISGMEFVGPKMPEFIKSARKIAKDRKILVYCWRGGMRSESMAYLLYVSGFEVYRLKGGYKAYRRFVQQHFGQKLRMVVLGGMTGSGKSEMLCKLKESGHQILDLEALANHKGSVYGAIGQPSQPTGEHFENLLYEKWKKLDLSTPVWVEDESHDIGKIHIPPEIFEQMRLAPVVKLELPREFRAKRLVKEYAGTSSENLIAALKKIEKRIGGQHMKVAEEAINKGDFYNAALINLVYYDKAYEYGLSKREPSTIFPLELAQDNTEENVEKVLDLFIKKIEGKI